MKNNILKLIQITLLLCIICLFSGCNNKSQINSNNDNDKKNNTQYTFTDDLGREITVSSANRVAILNASYAEIWSLSGGANQIVAVPENTWTDVSIQLSDDVINLGTHNEISLEKLLSSNPDFVIASTDIGENVDQLESYEKAGLNIAYFGVTSYEDYLRMLKICTDITGDKDKYEKYGTAIKEQVDNALSKIDGSSPKVLYLRATTGGVKAKNSKGSVLGQMLKDMGCVNISDLEDSLLEDISMEVIIKQNPDYIFVVYMGNDTAKIEEQLELALFSNGAWETLSAVKNGNVHIMEKELFNMKPNARWGEAYEKLANILYGN